MTHYKVAGTLGEIHEARGWCKHPDCGLSSTYPADLHQHTLDTGHPTVWVSSKPIRFERVSEDGEAGEAP